MAKNLANFDPTKNSINKLTLLSQCFLKYPYFNLIKVSLNMKHWNGIVRAWCADITLSFIFYPTKRDFIAAHKYQMSSDFFCYQTCLWHASMFYTNPLTTLPRGLPIKVSDSDRKQKQFLQTACKNILAPNDSWIVFFS